MKCVYCGGIMFLVKNQKAKCSDCGSVYDDGFQEWFRNIQLETTL